MSTVLVTGGAGFIGSNFVRFWLDGHPDDRVVVYDALTYAATLDSLADVAAVYEDRYRFVRGNICDAGAVAEVLTEERPDVLVNFAAESHNSRAIQFSETFYETNVVGTHTLLQAARDAGTPRIHHVSTCEVYGDLPLDSAAVFTEESPLLPNTHYSASKAAGDLVVRAFHESFGLPVTVSRGCNNFGPCQFPEKVIPRFATLALAGEPMTLYRHSDHRREWLHVLDHSCGIEAILRSGRLGEIYNIGSGEERDVEWVADAVAGALGLSDGYKSYVADRPGHDRRYLLDSTKLATELGWSPQVDLDAGVRETARWYRDHPEWWQPLLKRVDIDESAWPASG